MVYVDFATLMLYHTGVPLINQQRRFDSASFFTRRYNMTTRIRSHVIILAALMVISERGYAQFTIVYSTFDVPGNVVSAVAGSGDQKGIVATPPAKFEAGAKKAGVALKEQVSTVSVSGNGNFAADVVMEQGRMEIIYVADKQTFYLFQPGSDKVTVITDDDMQMMARQMEKVQNTMSGINDMLNNALKNVKLSEEQKARMLEGMRDFNQLQQGGGEAKVSEGGSRRDILGRSASLFYVEEASGKRGVWATPTDKELVAQFAKIGETFKAMFPMQNRPKQDYELVPGQLPLEHVQVDKDGSVKALVTREIRRKEPAKSVFDAESKMAGKKVVRMKDMIEAGLQGMPKQ